MRDKIMKPFVKTLLFGLAILFVVICIPICIFWGAGLTPPKAWTPIPGGTPAEQTWISFAGAYIGAIIGAVGAIVIMFRTLREGKKEKIDNRRYTDYLYIRDSIEDLHSTLDGSNTQTVFSQLAHLIEADFVIPDLDRLKEDYMGQRSSFLKTRRALLQSIIPLDSKSIDGFSDAFSELQDWQTAFLEFLEKIIVDNRICDDIENWGEHRAFYTDKIYEELVDDYNRYDYRMEADYTPIKYSFTRVQYEGEPAFASVIPIYDGLSVSMGDELVKTSFCFVFSAALQEYVNNYSEIISSIERISDSLIKELKSVITI